jgi:hypothetical protein
MNRKFSPILKKICFLAGALILGWTAQAQSSTPPPATSDTTRHHDGMHRHWDNRPGGSGRDSAWAHHRPGQGRKGFRGKDGGEGRWAHRGGNGQFGHGQHGFSRGDFARGRGFGPHYTPEQRQQVAAINKDYRQKSADLYKQDNLTLKQYKAGLIALQKEKKTKLDGLLTQQQKDDMASRRKRMSENAQVMQVARLERLKLHLNLSDDQVAKIKAGQDGLRSQVKAIHENDNLLPQQKMEQMKALMAKRNDTYKAVLTPDQYTQFEQMSHHRGDRFGGGRMGHRPGSGDDSK